MLLSEAPGSQLSKLGFNILQRDKSELEPLADSHHSKGPESVSSLLPHTDTPWLLPLAVSQVKIGELHKYPQVGRVNTRVLPGAGCHQHFVLRREALTSCMCAL